MKTIEEVLKKLDEIIAWSKAKPKSGRLFCLYLQNYDCSGFERNSAEKI